MRSVYTGKLKGNQVSTFSPNRNKSKLLGKTIRGHQRGKGNGVNSQLILLEWKGTATYGDAVN